MKGPTHCKISWIDDREPFRAFSSGVYILLDPAADLYTHKQKKKMDTKKDEDRNWGYSKIGRFNNTSLKKRGGGLKIHSIS